MKSKIKELFAAYKDLIGEIYREKPFMVIMTFLAAILLGSLRIIHSFPGK